MISRIKLWIYNFFKWFFGITGAFVFLFVIIAFTDIPYVAYHDLGDIEGTLTTEPEVIVVMGGSGMPSPDGLMRTYYASLTAMQYPDASIIIAHPYSEGDSLYQLKLMAHELVAKGVDSSRIQYEPHGFSKRSQAVNIAALFKDRMSTGILIVTSPEHMYRSVRAFQKVGFTNVGGVAADENPIAAEDVKDKDASKDTRVKSLSFRYNMWSYLHYELFVIKEYCAIAYYKLKGWI